MTFKTISAKMKTIFTTLILFVFMQFGFSQGTVCNSNGNLVIITNYDGGPLDLVVDVNIPNLIIGLVSYEALQVTLSGPYVNNVVAVHYAGVNSNNNHCNTVIPTTIITGAPVTASISIDITPPSPVTNPNGNPNIICAYTCDTTTTQGGCNTIDQVEGYFLQQHPGSVIYSHHVQYGCYAAPLLVSQGGNCCPNPISPLTLLTAVSPVSCIGTCNGSAGVTATGGTPPYSYFWSNGNTTPSDTSLCPGTYTITVTDSNNVTATTQFTITQPTPVSYFPTITGDNGSCNGSISVVPFGGSPPFTYTWDSCGSSGGSTSPSIINVCAGTCCVTITNAGGCSDTVCFIVPSTVGLQDLNGQSENIFPNPSADGSFNLSGYNLNELGNIFITDLSGRTIIFQINPAENGYSVKIASGAGMYFLKYNSVVKKLLVTGAAADY